MRRKLDSVVTLPTTTRAGRFALLLQGPQAVTLDRALPARQPGRSGVARRRDDRSLDAGPRHTRCRRSDDVPEPDTRRTRPASRGISTSSSLSCARAAPRTPTNRARSCRGDWALQCASLSLCVGAPDRGKRDTPCFSWRHVWGSATARDDAYGSGFAGRKDAGWRVRRRPAACHPLPPAGGAIGSCARLRLARAVRHGSGGVPCPPDGVRRVCARARRHSLRRFADVQGRACSRISTRVAHGSRFPPRSPMSLLPRSDGNETT